MATTHERRGSGNRGEGRPLRQLLTALESFRRPPPAKAGAWWNEGAPAESRAASAAPTARQIEFWGPAPETPVRAVAVTDTPRPEPEAVSMQVGPVDRRPAVWGEAISKKGSVMSPVGIGRFLKLGGSIYDGRDEGRWFALPERKKPVRFELVREALLPAVDSRVLRSSVRVGTTRSDGL